MPGQEPRLKENAGQYASIAADLKKKEERYYWMWRWGGFAARLLFLAGLVCLFIFATVNALQRTATLERKALIDSTPTAL